MKYYFTHLGRFIALMSIIFVSACSSDNDVIEPSTLPSSPVIHEYELSHETGEDYDIYYKFNEKVIRLTQTDLLIIFVKLRTTPFYIYQQPHLSNCFLRKGLYIQFL